MDKEKNRRMCIACREKRDKKEFIRVVRFQGEYSIDKTGKKNGRGAYICDNMNCVTLAVKKKLLNKAFKENIPDEIYELLLKEYESDKAE